MGQPKPDTQALYEDKTAGRWLNKITKPNTRNVYVLALKRYMKFTGLTPAELIDEAIEDQRRDPRTRLDIVLQRVQGFYRWLKTEYVQSNGTKGESDRAAMANIIGVRSFYADYDISVRLKGANRLPKPKTKNKRMTVNAEQVKTLLDHTPNIRDRAIVLTLFQSGIDVDTLCSLKYGDVSAGLNSGELPLKLELQRTKTGVEFETFLGRSAVGAIKAYIRDREARGVRFDNGSPLFQKEAQTYDAEGKPKSKALETQLVQIMMKGVASKAGFVESKGYNVLGPHSLRESFGSIMINSGVPDAIVDFWLGHSIGPMAEAYKKVQSKEVVKMYKEREKLLDPYAALSDTEVDRIRADLEKRIGELVARNEDLEDRLKKVEKALRLIYDAQVVINGNGKP